jgi:hypothetical protein
MGRSDGPNSHQRWVRVPLESEGSDSKGISHPCNRCVLLCRTRAKENINARRNRHLDKPLKLVSETNEVSVKRNGHRNGRTHDDVETAEDMRRFIQKQRLLPYKDHAL